jgi:hypothetical protein
LFERQKLTLFEQQSGLQPFADLLSGAALTSITPHFPHADADDV